MKKCQRRRNVKGNEEEKSKWRLIVFVLFCGVFKYESVLIKCKRTIRNISDGVFLHRLSLLKR